MRLIVDAIRLEEIKCLFKFILYFFALVSSQSAAFSSATQLGVEWPACLQNSTENGERSVYTRFHLPNLLCAGYRMKQILYLYKNTTKKPFVFIWTDEMSVIMNFLNVRINWSCGIVLNFVYTSIVPQTGTSNMQAHFHTTSTK